MCADMCPSWPTSRRRGAPAVDRHRGICRRLSDPIRPRGRAGGCAGSVCRGTAHPPGGCVVTRGLGSVQSCGRSSRPRSSRWCRGITPSPITSSAAPVVATATLIVGAAVRLSPCASRRATRPSIRRLSPWPPCGRRGVPLRPLHLRAGHTRQAAATPGPPAIARARRPARRDLPRRSGGRRQDPPLLDAVDAVLDHARFGSLPVILAIVILNGIAESSIFVGRSSPRSVVGTRSP